MAQNGHGAQVGNMLAKLVGHTSFAEYEFECATLLVVNVFDALLKAQHIARIRHAVKSEALLAVQQLAVVHAQQVTDRGRVG